MSDFPTDDDFDLGAFDFEFEELGSAEIDREIDRMQARTRARKERIPASPPLVRPLYALVKEICKAEDVHESPAFRELREYLCEPKPVGPEFYPINRFEAFGVDTGGLGLVIKARDPETDELVALKLWKQEDRELQEALHISARALGRLSHPNALVPHETGTWRDWAYYVMDWIEGIDMHSWVCGCERPGWLAIRDALVIAGRGLAAAHDAGFRHRGFKPSNILIGDDGRVAAADFCIVELMEAVGDYQAPFYMSPERLRGDDEDARSDQYSFCASMWRAFHGVRPHAGATVGELLDEIAAGELQSGSETVPEWLSAVARRGMAPEPDSRFPDMHELVEALTSGPSDEPQRVHEPVEVDERGLLN